MTVDLTLYRFMLSVSTYEMRIKAQCMKLFKTMNMPRSASYLKKRPCTLFIHFNSRQYEKNHV